MNKITRFIFIICLLAMAVPMTVYSQSINTNLAVGTPEGSFAVSSMGGATYSVSIEAPKGLPGIQPQVSINYNSQAGNGLVGFGCNLSGFSVITRGPRSIWYDNMASGTTYESDDAFFLDGQRLIEQENITGCDSAVYCLETSPYTCIVLHGRNASSQESMWFEMTTPDGTKSQYNIKQFILKNSAFKVNAWFITSVNNAVGNYAYYQYTYAGNYPYPNKISYGDNTIEFTYEARPDTIFFSYEGNQGNIGKRLKTIKTKTDNNVYREYTLNYSTGDATATGFSHLSTVTVKNGAGETMNPITFNWEYLKQFNTQPESLDINLDQSYQLVSFLNGFELSTADFNGDGISDIVQKAGVASIEAGDGHTYYYNNYYFYRSHLNNNGQIYSSSPKVLSFPFYAMSWKMYVNYPMTVDIDGDGLQDIIIPYGLTNNNYNITEAHFFIITGKELDTLTTVYPKTYIPTNASMVPLYTSVDYDNDGRSDLLLLEQASSNNYYHCHIYRGSSNINNMSELDTSLYLSSAPKKLISGDFNADGMADILVFCENGYKIFWNRGGGLSNNTFSSSDCTSGTNLSDNNMVRDGDFNGDGLPDILTNATNSNDWYFYLNKGDGTFTKKLACQKDIYDQSGSFDDDKFTCLVYDMDGDGKSDVYMSKAMYYPFGLFQQVRSYWMLSNGSSLIQKKASTSQKAENAAPGNYMLGSFSGDGQPELAHYGYDCYNGVDANVSSTLRKFPNSNYAPGNGKVKTITNGLGHTSQITYKSLTDESVYTRSGIGEYPLFIVKPALPVVSTTTIGNGMAGNLISDYTYEDLIVHQPGRGLLGFTTMTTVNETMGTTTETSTEWDELTLAPYKTWETQTVGGSTATVENTYLNHRYRNTKAIYHSLASSIVTDLDGHVTNTVYSCDSLHHNVPLEITQTNYDNAQVKTTYNSYDQKAGQYLPTSVSTRRKHPDDTQYFTTTNTFTYNNQGLKASETNFYGTSAETTTTYTYDYYGNLKTTSTSGTGVETVTTQYTYDSSNRFVSQSLERGYIKNVYTYDTWGNVLTASDQTRSSYPLTTTNTYDNWGRLETSTSPIGITTNQQWKWLANGGYYIHKTEAGQPWLKIYYDNTGRKWQTQSIGAKGVSIQETLTYNNKGLLASKTNTEGYTSLLEEFTYDSRGRILSDNLSSGESTTFTYGANWIRTNKAGHIFTKYYDSWGNLKSSYDPASSVIYKYYSNGNPKSATTGGNVVSMQYDTAGRRTKMTDPSAGETNYTYDAYGRLLTQTDARGYTTTNTYDSRGQLTNSTTGTIADNYVYGNNSTNNGLLVSASRYGMSILYTYDNYGRLINENHMTGMVGKEMTYTYDTQGHLATQTYPNLLQISYEYDNYGYINRMFSGTKQLYKLEVYTGDTREATLDNSITDISVYDQFGRLDEAAFNFNGSDKYYQKYEYSQYTGNITSRTLGSINNNPETFTYDALDRLVSWTKSGSTQYYEYESNGFMFYKGGLGSFSYNSNNPYAISDMENPLGSLAIPQSYVTTEYNELGMVKKIDSPAYHTQIAYGPNNQRWRSTESDMVYYFDNYEEITTNNVTRSFIYLENGVLAVSDNTNGTQFYYMATDILGSVMGIIDGSGNEVFTATYDPWGKQTVTRNDLGFRRGFTGHEMLPHYDLINMNGRLYDPYLAQFLSPDNYVQLPDFSQSFNRYSYCLNNPLKYTDPSGELFGIDDLVLFSLAVNTYINICSSLVSGESLGNTAISSVANFAMNAGLAYATNGIGNILGHETKSFGTEILRAGMHGVVNGVGSAINGESFGTGFLTGSVSSLVGSGVSALGSPSYLTIPAMGGVGGIVSELSGGNWFDGVRTGINIGLFNHGWEKINGEWYYVSDGVEIIGHRRNVINSVHMVLDAAGLVFDFADLLNSGIYAFEGDYLNAGISAAAMVPVVGSLATGGKIAEKGFSSYSKFKKAYGRAGDGMEWHHIVEQRPANISQFGAERIHNIDNMIALPTDAHRKISGHYSSLRRGTNNMRVRDWLNGKDYDFQYQYGLKILKKYGY